MNWLKTGRQVSFITLSQINRAGYEKAKDDNGKYGATAMAEANELERASTLVLTVFAETEMKDLGIAKVQVLKYRDNRNEDDPTEVSIDLHYYMFGDNSDGMSEISMNIDSAATDLISEAEERDSSNIKMSQELLDEFSEFMPKNLEL